MNGKVVATDPRKMPVQRKNLTKYVIVWESQLIGRANITHKPNQWIIFPDDYYIPWIEKIGSNTKGVKLEMQCNMGKSIDFNLR